MPSSVAPLPRRHPPLGPALAAGAHRQRTRAARLLDAAQVLGDREMRPRTGTAPPVPPPATLLVHPARAKRRSARCTNDVPPGHGLPLPRSSRLQSGFIARCAFACFPRLLAKAARVARHACGGGRGPAAKPSDQRRNQGRPPPRMNGFSAPSAVRPLARDPRVLIGWPLPLGFGLGKPCLHRALCPPPRAP